MAKKKKAYQCLVCNLQVHYVTSKIGKAHKKYKAGSIVTVREGSLKKV